LEGQVRRSLLVVAILLMVFGFTTSAYAKDPDDAEKDFRKSFPNFKVDSFKGTPAKEIYEVVSADQIFYFSADGYLFAGEMISKDGQSMTAQRRNEMMAAKAKELPLEKALKIGNGKKVVVEFTDPLCPFCRRAYESLSKRTDITQYVFFFPLEQIHPEARKMAKYVLCSSNPAAAFDEIMSGKLEGKKFELLGSCKEEILDEQIKVAQKVGIRGTPNFFINGKYIVGADMPLIDKVLAD
jgi:thiol:disulfide interchange protein DsbC